MKILVAEDEATSRMLLGDLLGEWGFTVVSAEDGNEAWEILSSPESPGLAVLDWMMPGVDGLELCRRVKSREDTPYVYTLLLTSKSGKEDIVEGLDAGADDFLTKPVDPGELRSRLAVGQRILKYEATLAEKITELADALSKIRTLSGLMPICSVCKSVRDDKGYWSEIEAYIHHHSDAELSHSLCPDCEKKAYAELEQERAASKSS